MNQKTDLTQRLADKAAVSAEALAAGLTELLDSEELDQETPNDHPIVSTMRALRSERSSRFASRLREALAILASNIEPPTENPELSLTIAMLFKYYSTPSTALALATRLLRERDHGRFFSWDSKHLDILTDAILSQSTHPNVRNFCIQIANDDRFKVIAIKIFLGLAKTDADALTFIADRVFKQMPDYPRSGGIPLYVKRFDATFSLADVQTILKNLSPKQASGFTSNVISFSKRFVFTQNGVTERRHIIAPSEAEGDPFVEYFDLGPITISDSRESLSITPDAQASIYLGAMEHFWKNRKAILQELGLKEEPLLAAA